MTEGEHWSEQAACKDSPIDFHTSNPQEKAQAKALCFSCPVRQLCLQTALDSNERYGVWGGVDEVELRKVLAIDAAGKTLIHANRRIRCPFCGPRSTKHLRVKMYKRTRTLVECSNCETTWWTRKIINKKGTNW